MTRAPIGKPRAPGPASMTSPDASRPRITGSSIGMTPRSSPLRIFQSIGLMLAPDTRTLSSPGPTRGAGSSRSSSLSTSPYPVRTTAFMTTGCQRSRARLVGWWCQERTVACGGARLRRARRVAAPPGFGADAPAKLVGERVVDAEHGVGDDRADHRGELEAGAGAAGGDGEGRPAGGGGDPEGGMAGVAVDAQPAGRDRGVGQRGQRAAQEVAQRGFLIHRDLAGSVGGERDAGAMIGNLHDTVMLDWKTVIAGTRDIGAEHRELEI